MEYKIIADSSCEVNEDLQASLDISHVPFKIDVEDKNFIDNYELDLGALIKEMNGSKEAVRTSCPSPGDFVEAYGDHKNIFVITISSKLSGTYNSALLAKEMVLEKDPTRKIHVFDSKSASIGETLVALKIKEFIDLGCDYEEIIRQVEGYIEGLETMFILESLDNLIKNGRISKTKGLIANVLNIKPIMGAEDGSIGLVENVRGKKRAFKRLVELIGERASDMENKILAISHVDNLETAEELKNDIKKAYNFKDIILLHTRGLSTAYGDDGGIILAF